MSSDTAIAQPVDGSNDPIVRKIDFADLREVLNKGLSDFNEKPSHFIFLTIIYPIIGLVLARATGGGALLPLFFPLVAGFALVGPFAAIGVYEVSRRRELGLDASLKDAFQVLRSPSIGAIATLGLILMAIFVTWLAVAALIFYVTLGSDAAGSVSEFARAVFTTPGGWALIILGNGIGFLFAAVVLAISVVSFPLLLDRNVGVKTAIRTSVRAVQENPQTMAIWGLIVAASLAVGSLPLFVGLAVAMPILGHATWHLYRKVVAR